MIPAEIVPPDQLARNVLAAWRSGNFGDEISVKVIDFATRSGGMLSVPVLDLHTTRFILCVATARATARLLDTASHTTPDASDARDMRLVASALRQAAVASEGGGTA